MASRLHQWEMDSLFSAAEVVRDSADRMESIFRLLFHEQRLVREDHADQRLLKSIDYHRRDLATILETTRWQLEDFERAINSLVAKNESRSEAVIVRHKHFISAIKEHVMNVENSLQHPSYRDSLRSSKSVSLNEQDRNGLALFLSGGNPSELSKHTRADDSVTENKGSDLDLEDSLQEICCEDRDRDGSLDMEANEGKSKTFFQKSQQRGHHRRGEVFQFLNNVKAAFGRRVARNYTKKFKDGEEQSDSAPYMDASYGAQLTPFTNAMHWLGQQCSPMNMHRTIYIILLLLSVIIVIGFLLSRMV